MSETKCGICAEEHLRRYTRQAKKLERSRYSNEPTYDMGVNVNETHICVAKMTMPYNVRPCISDGLQEWYIFPLTDVAVRD